jgi:hypothetical protein
MAVKTVYVVQAFETQRKRLVPTTKIDAPSEILARFGAVPDDLDQLTESF